MKNCYLRLILTSKNIYSLKIYSNKGRLLDSVGSFQRGVGIDASILRVRFDVLSFWLSFGLRPTLFIKRFLILGDLL